MSTLCSRMHVCAMILLVTSVGAQTLPKNQPPLWSAKPDIAAFEKMENDRLAAAQRCHRPDRRRQRCKDHREHAGPLRRSDPATECGSYIFPV